MNNFVAKLKRACVLFQKKCNLILHRRDKNVVFSIGENCLSDNILSRNNLKSFSSPFSSGLSNIEYVLSFENEKYKDFLSKAYLKYEPSGDDLKVRNKKFVEVYNKYDKSVTNGFEFTHHDVLKKHSLKRTMRRRYKRILNLKRKNIIMLYHHRCCVETDMTRLFDDLSKLAEVYMRRGNNVRIFAFSQEIIEEREGRRVTVENLKDGQVNYYKFCCLQKWCGNDDNVFWAKCDDDLIKVMIDDIKKALI